MKYLILLLFLISCEKETIQPCPLTFTGYDATLTRANLEVTSTLPYVQLCISSDGRKFNCFYVPEVAYKCIRIALFNDETIVEFRGEIICQLII